MPKKAKTRWDVKDNVVIVAVPVAQVAVQVVVAITAKGTAAMVASVSAVGIVGKIAVRDVHIT